MAGFFRKRGDNSENFPRAERNLHAAADINLPGEFGRNRIIKFLPQRNFQTDAGDHFQSRVMARSSVSTSCRNFSRSMSVSSRGI